MKKQQIIAIVIYTTIVATVIVVSFFVNSQNNRNPQVDPQNEVIIKVENGVEIKMEELWPSATQEKINLQRMIQGILARGDEGECDTFSTETRYKTACHNLFLLKRAQ